MSMICSLCEQTGIRWMGSYGNLTHTECPHCGGVNCQHADQPDAQCPECGECGCNGQCAGDDMMGASS